MFTLPLPNVVGNSTKAWTPSLKDTIITKALEENCLQLSIMAL